MRDADIAMWLRACHSSDPARQIAAIQHLLALGTSDCVPTLIDTLKSPDAVVRCTAAGALARLGQKDPWTVGAALVDLLKDPEVIVRSEAVDALGILRYSLASKKIEALLLNDPEPLVRASAAEALGDMGDASVLRALELALHDTDNAVRGYAANSIGLLGATSKLLKLQSFAEREQSPEVKAELHGAVYRLGSTEGLSALLKLLEVADEKLAANILNILNDLSGRNAPPTLADDAARILSAMTALRRRTSLLSADVDQIISRLGRVGHFSPEV